MARHGRLDSAPAYGYEGAFVYARRRDAERTDPLYYLRDGQAQALRDFTRRELRCPLPHCPTPDLTTVSRSEGRRDGFMHLDNNLQHRPESFAHERGKILLAKAVRDRYPLVEVRLEARVGSGQRRADVLLTGPDQRLVAIEVQYASLTVGEWSRRHDSYRVFGVRDVWLLGSDRLKHVGYSGIPGDNEPRYMLSKLEQAILDSGTQLLWLDVEKGFVGLGVVGSRRPRPKELFRIDWRPVEEVLWTPTGAAHKSWPG